jgi:DNA-directed RNA polymerase specialized sigma24 family protein
MFLGKYELSEREVSAITGLPKKTVNNRKKTAFKKISTFLKK